MRTPERANETASPNDTVVLPWLPSGLVSTMERRFPLVKSRLVRRSRSDSATIRNFGSARSRAACTRASAGSFGISA